LPVNEKSIARGNIVLADHGLTKEGKKLFPISATDEEDYYPKLPDMNITVAVPYDHATEISNGANVTIKQDPHKALSSVSLVEANDQEPWEAQKDLLGSDRFANEFVVETEQDGTSSIRFGDNILGRKPSNGFEPGAIYRIGNGKEGNVGAESINTIVLKGGGIEKVRNPMAASGGTDPETMEEIRQFAPQAFRKQERAVTESDYIEKTELHPEVQKATAKFYWTGSWYTVYIIIDRKEGKEINKAFRSSIIKHLEQYRLAGYDLEIRAPKFVPLSIILVVCVKPGYFRSNVKQSLLESFSSYDLFNGTRGFFHPDNFTFGQAVYLSTIYKRAMDVQGVASVEIIEFKRWAKKPNMEIDDGYIQPSELEIIRLDNDPNFPENGKIDFKMFGGL
jgi:predicted phage baseplate assembly protein